MAERRRWHGVRERARGVGFVVGLGLTICLIGLGIAAAMSWVL